MDTCGGLGAAAASSSDQLAASLSPITPNALSPVEEERIVAFALGHTGLGRRASGSSSRGRLRCEMDRHLGFYNEGRARNGRKTRGQSPMAVLDKGKVWAE